MSNIYYTQNLINNEYLAAYSPLPVNYNFDEIRPFITIAESIWVVDILGKKLYNELLKQVEENNITEANSTLLLKIYPYLAMAVTYEALPFIAHHFSEKGITNGKSDNSEPISNVQMVNIQNHVRTELEVLKRLLKEFLEDNKDSYPLYATHNCTYSNDECVWVDMVWNGIDASAVRDMRWRSLKKNILNSPNANLRLYSNN